MATPIVLGLALGLGLACGGDDGGGSSSLSAGGSAGSGSSADSSESDTSAPEDGTGSSSGDGSSSGAIDGSSSSEEGGSTGVPGDPTYPEPGAGGCRDAAVLDLQGVSVCAPFCSGADGVCPAAASGEATPICTPFEMPGGGGTACLDHSECDAEEACGIDGTCIAVAFWGCRLSCDGGETCPDAMTCAAAGSCGYPQ